MMSMIFFPPPSSSLVDVAVASAAAVVVVVVLLLAAAVATTTTTTTITRTTIRPASSSQPSFYFCQALTTISSSTRRRWTPLLLSSSSSSSSPQTSLVVPHSYSRSRSSSRSQSRSSSTSLFARNINRRGGGGGGQSRDGGGDPREFFQVQQTLQADLRLAEERQERLRREILDAQQRRRKLQSEAKRRQSELDAMKRRGGLTSTARKLAKQGPVQGLDRERQALEQELDDIMARERNQRTSRRLGTLGAIAIATGAFWNFITDDGVGSTYSSPSQTITSTVSRSTTTALPADAKAQLPYLEKEIERTKQDLAKSKDELEKERIRADEKMAIEKAEIERVVAKKKAQTEQEVARLKADQEKEVARKKADQVKEAARIKSEQEAKASKLKEEQRVVELKKIEDEFRQKEVQFEKDATKRKEEIAKEVSRIKAEQEKEIAKLKTEKETVMKKRAERGLLEQKKIVDIELKRLTELEASKKQLMPPPPPPPPAAPKPAPAPAPAAPPKPAVVDARKVSDEEAAKIRQITQKASEQKNSAPKSAPKAATPAAKTTSSPKQSPKAAAPKADSSKDGAKKSDAKSSVKKDVKKDVKKAVGSGNKAISDARKKVDKWWSKYSKVEKNQKKASVALTAGAITIAGVYNGLRDGTWSTNVQGVAGRWYYSPYTSYNSRRRRNYGGSVNQYGGGSYGGGGGGGVRRGQGRTARTRSRVRGNVNGLGGRNSPVGFPDAAGGPSFGSQQQDLYSSSGGIPGRQAPNQRNQGYQSDMASKLRRNQKNSNPFQLRNPFARTPSTSRTGTSRSRNNFETPTRNVRYNTNSNIDVNARGVPPGRNNNSFRSSPSSQYPPGPVGDTYINGARQQSGGFATGGVDPVQSQSSSQQPGGFSPPVSPSAPGRMQQPGGFAPPGSQNQFQNGNQQQPLAGGRSQIPGQSTVSNQRQQSQYSRRVPAAPTTRDPNYSQGQQQSSPFSNQGRTSRSTLGDGFSAGAGPTGGRVPLQGVGSQSAQRQGSSLRQGFDAGNGPNVGRTPASGLSNPFSSNNYDSGSARGGLGQGFSAGRGSTGGNRVPPTSVNGVNSQGLNGQAVNGFSPFGGRNSQTQAAGSQGARMGQNSQTQQQQRNSNSPFGGSPGGSTAGFSPFGRNSNTNGASATVAPAPGSRFGGNGSPPGRQGGRINGAAINGAGINGAGYGGGASRVNGASGTGFNNNPSNPLSPPGKSDNYNERQAQEQARRLEEARREGIAEARREAQRGRQSNQGLFGPRSQVNNGSGPMLDRGLLNAIKSSDEKYKPPQVILDAPSITPLLEQVDGPNLYQYDETEKVYSGRAVKVMAESSLDIPIRISAPGSIVEYTVEKKSYDFNLGITAKLDQGGTAVVKPSAPFDGRQDRAKTITDQVLVGAGSVPCTLNFKFENNYTWILEVTYRIRIIPPPRETLVEGRRRRTKAAIRAVETDLSRLKGQQSSASRRRNQLETEVNRLQNQIQNKYGAATSPVGRRY